MTRVPEDNGHVESEHRTPVAESASIDYTLGQYGWSSFNLTIGAASIDVSKFGYCTDALERFHREWKTQPTVSLREAKRRSNPLPHEPRYARQARDCFVASLLAMTGCSGDSTHGENARGDLIGAM
jgi:hypothetical protein